MMTCLPAQEVEEIAPCGQSKEAGKAALRGIVGLGFQEIVDERLVNRGQSKVRIDRRKLPRQPGDERFEVRSAEIRGGDGVEITKTAMKAQSLRDGGKAGVRTVHKCHRATRRSSH